MNECKRVRVLLALRRQDRSEEERHQVEAHLGTCAGCAAIALAYAEQDRLIGDAPRREAPRVSLTPAQRSQLLSRVRRDEKRRLVRRRLATALSTVAAVAVLLAVAGGLAALLRPAERIFLGQPTTTLPGPGVADLLRNPPAAGQTVEVDAYFSGGGVALLRTGPPPLPDQVVCPTWQTWQVALTDRPFPAALQILNSAISNMPPDDAPWLAATTPEAIQAGQVILPQLPYHARFRGHLGDPAFAACPNADRIFVVEEVVTVYEEQPPEPAANAWQPPSDYAAWPRYHDAEFGYSLPYPPGWSVEPLAEPDAESVLSLHAPQWPDFPVVLRVHAGEIRYDQYDPTSISPLLQGDSWGVFEQGWAFNEQVDSQHLAGFDVERQAGSDRRSVAVLFSAGGYTYELAITYPTGFDAPQPLLTAYTAIVEGFRLDTTPGPTPTPPVKQTLGPGPFLSLDEALARVREREGQEVELLYAKLVSEAEARSRADACSSFLGHPDGVWLLTVRGYFEEMTRTLNLFLDATSGEQLCGEEIVPESTPWPTMLPGTTATPAPTETPAAAP
jgi:hypothetical protein